MLRRSLDEAMVVTTPVIPMGTLPTPRGPAAETGRSLETSVASADEALEQGAFNRLRVYRIAALCWCLLGVLVATLIPGRLRDHVTCWLSVALFVGSYLLRDSTGSPRERVKKMFPVAVVQTFAALGITAGLGISSPFNALVVVALVLYALSAPRRHSRVIYGLLAGSYAVLSCLVLVGFLSGTGLLAPFSSPSGRSSRTRSGSKGRTRRGLPSASSRGGTPRAWWPSSSVSSGASPIARPSCARRARSWRGWRRWEDGAPSRASTSATTTSAT